MLRAAWQADGDHLARPDATGLERRNDTRHARSQFGVADLPLAADQGDPLVGGVEQVLGDLRQEPFGTSFGRRAIEAIVRRVDDRGGVHGELTAGADLADGLFQRIQDVVNHRWVQDFPCIVDIQHQRALGVGPEANIHGHLRRLGQAALQLHETIRRQHRPGKTIGNHHRQHRPRAVGFE